MNFTRAKILELQANLESLIIVFYKLDEKKYMATDNEQKIELLNREILREGSILQALQKGLNVEETEGNSLRLGHVRDEVERIKAKIRKMDTKVRTLNKK